MIDFETMAEARARSLGQPSENWVKLLSDPHFGAACVLMTDGEIAQVFEISKTPEMLKSLFEALDSAGKNGVESPLDVIKAAAAQKGASLENAVLAFVSGWASSKDFESALRSLTFAPATSKP